jgi:hypothetical protein
MRVARTFSPGSRGSCRSPHPETFEDARASDDGEPNKSNEGREEPGAVAGPFSEPRCAMTLCQERVCSSTRSPSVTSSSNSARYATTALRRSSVVASPVVVFI